MNSEMKKLSLLFVLFIFTLSLTSASSSFSFSGEGDIYGSILSDGKVETGSIDAIVKTAAKAESRLVSFEPKKNTLLLVKVEDERVVIYLNDKKINAASSEGTSIPLYTPVTKTEGTSTETKKKIYNDFSPQSTAYDAIRCEASKNVPGYFKGYVSPQKKIATKFEEAAIEELRSEEITPDVVPGVQQFLSTNIKLKEMDDCKNGKN